MPRNLPALLLEKGYTHAALTDINNTCMSLEYAEACQQAGLPAIVGIDFRNMQQDCSQLYVVIAQNTEGFKNINDYISPFLHDKIPFPKEPLPLAHTFVIYPLNNIPARPLRENEFIGIRPQDLNRLIRYSESYLKRKAVALYTVTYQHREDFYLHCLLRTIDCNTLLSKLQPHQVGSREEAFISADMLIHLYARYPFLINNAQNLLEQCAFVFDYKSHKNKRNIFGSLQADVEKLNSLALEGLRRRYPIHQQTQALQRLQSEMEVIAQKDFISYFLMAWDVIRYAKSKNYFYIGRGSGANSIAAYCLGITDVDPIELDLYFERFLNLHRTSPPDFDIDFSWKDRDDIFTYLFRTYDNVAMVGSFTTFKLQAALRELGKAFGLPKEEIDEIQDSGSLMRKGVKGVSQKMDLYRAKIAKYAHRLIKLPNLLSVHPSGILISEIPIHNFCATSMPPKGFPITQIDMYTADKIHLYKLDILSQRGLGHIKDSIHLIRQNRGETVDIHNDVNRKDPHLNQLLSKGDTIGCFYIESPAMRQLLLKLKCQTYPVLVAASSIIRPGVSGSGMMKEYIFRHNNPDKYRPIHPKIDEILKETYGVMVYQEDVIKVAHHFGGLELAESDTLRRAMAWKHRLDDGFDIMEKRFFENCHKKGYPEAISREVWRQMEGFAGYSFCKAHSASYAVESYQSLYLKTYYPLEFMVAVINNFGGYYNAEFYISEARRNGGIIHAPCLNTSLYLTNIYGRDIYLGFVHIKSLEQEFAEKIVTERESGGVYSGLPDFCRRLKPGLEQLLLLIQVSAFRFTGKQKNQLVWEAVLLLSEKKQSINIGESLFPQAVIQYDIPPQYQTPQEEAYDEIECIGFSVQSPFVLLTSSYRGEIRSRDMINNIGKKVEMVGYLIHIRGHRSAKGYMQFGLLVDEDGETFNSISFPPVYQRHPFRMKGIYKLQGKITEEYGAAYLELYHWEQMPISFLKKDHETKEETTSVVISLEDYVPIHSREGE